MKIKILLLVSGLFVSFGVNAASCLTPSEKKIVDRNHTNSLNSYDYIKVDCNQAKMKTVCSDAYNVKMLNTMIRMNVWDEENALKYEVSAATANDLTKKYTKQYANASCAIIKKNFKQAIGSNGGWDY